LFEPDSTLLSVLQVSLCSALSLSLSSHDQEKLSRLIVLRLSPADMDIVASQAADIFDGRDQPAPHDPQLLGLGDPAMHSRDTATSV
jgi:hypothetical protein